MNSRTKGERGIAMLIVLFALLLLTVIGLGMMYSTNMETAINSNYRDKQVAFYAALAGLQEARERIQPATTTISPPTALPSTTFQYVLYIVANASTVKPWDPDNEYFDTELCQEKVMGLTGTPGVPCAGTDDVPTGTLWYRYVDNSLSSSAPWNLTNPLDLKWVRITLKGNNNTPVPVNGSSSDGTATCWDGVGQMSTPTTYTTGCQPNGGVTGVAVATSGTLYTTAPMVEFSGGGGTGAAATAVMQAELTGYVSAITVGSSGSGYTSPPTVAFSSGGATATAVLSSSGTTVVTDGSVTAVTLSANGTGYTSAPTVSFGGPGSGATATAVLSTTGTVVTTGYVNNTTSVTSGGSLYTTAPTISFMGGGGSDAAATATLSSTGSVKSVTLGATTNRCFADANGPIVSFGTTFGGTGAVAHAVMETSKSCIYDKSLTGVTDCEGKLRLSPEGFNPANTKSGLTVDVGTARNSSLTLNVGANDKTPISMSIEDPGNDPVAAFQVSSFNAHLIYGTATTPTWVCATPTIAFTPGYRIASIAVTNGGSGYTSAPSVTITGGTGTVAAPTATSTLGYTVSGITVTNGGTGYTTAPTVVFSSGTAAGTVGITTTSTTTYPVASVTVTSGGTGYVSTPSVSFSGGSGSGVAGTASVASITTTTYPIASITIDSAGTGYVTAPTVTLSGGGGSGATATASISTMNSGTYYVHHINVDNTGSGYTSTPTVTLTGDGSGATAAADISGGTKYGKVWLATALAQTSTGARSMIQMELASPVLGFALGGALTLDGPNPLIDQMPNANGFKISGLDAHSCDANPEDPHPAIDGYDDPNANPPTNSVGTIISKLPRPDDIHYPGQGASADTPSVQNGYAALGETMTTPIGLNAVIAAIFNASGTAHYTTANAGTFNPSSTTKYSKTYVDGDLSLSGNSSGSGILVVTGTLELGGNFSWNGLILVVGDGNFQANGGGNGQINGSLIVAKIWDSYTTKNLLATLGSPTMHWNGGGGNGIQYDHCYATDLMETIPFVPPASTSPLKVLSTRILPY